MIARFLFSLLLLIPLSVQAHNHGDDSVQVVRVSDGVTMIQAGGGNIGVIQGNSGLFVIDSGLADANEKVKAAVKSIAAEKPVHILVNTHWHYDHVGNNETFQDGGAVVVAHDNVRKRMQAGQRIEAFDADVPPAAIGALPTLTYDGRTTMYIDDEPAHIHAVDPAHTDGDSFVHLPQSNVIHTGDLFFNGFWPFIDASSGGGIDGVIAASARILDVADENTKIIPGHGPLASKAELQAYHDVLKVVAERAYAAKAAGKSVDDWIAEKPLTDFESEWGDGLLPTDKWIGIVWDGLK